MDDELSWLFTKIFFILFAENSQVLLKLSVIFIFLTFMNLVALNLLGNNQLNSSLRHMIVTLMFMRIFTLWPQWGWIIYKGKFIYFFILISRQLKIRIIEYDGSGFVDSERNPHEDFVVSRFIVHPNFNKKRLSDDIAVIILEQPIDLVSKQGKLVCTRFHVNLFYVMHCHQRYCKEETRRAY